MNREYKLLFFERQIRNGVHGWSFTVSNQFNTISCFSVGDEKSIREKFKAVIERLNRIGFYHSPSKESKYQIHDYMVK